MRIGLIRKRVGVGDQVMQIDFPHDMIYLSSRKILNAGLVLFNLHLQVTD